MEKFSALLAICVGSSPTTGEFPAQRPVVRSFDVFFDLHLNEWLSKQSWGWWFDTSSRPLWLHSNKMELISFVPHVSYDNEYLRDTKFKNKHQNFMQHDICKDSDDSKRHWWENYTLQPTSLRLCKKNHV